MRILTIDYGERRTGLAVSDELGITAQGLDTLVVDDVAEIPDKVVGIVEELGVTKIVVGLPLNMNGSESEMSEKVRAFGDVLRDRTGLPVILWDERMTSMQAERVMQEIGEKTRGNKQSVDRISATLMLQEFLKTQV